MHKVSLTMHKESPLDRSLHGVGLKDCLKGVRFMASASPLDSLLFPQRSLHFN